MSGKEPCGRCNNIPISIVQNDKEIFHSTLNAGCCEDKPNYMNRSRVKNPRTAKLEISQDDLKELETYCKDLGINSLSYTSLTEDMKTEDLDVKYDKVIVFTIQFDQRIIDCKNGEMAETLNQLFYETYGNITFKISDFLREKGYQTQPSHPADDKLNLRKIAHNANLGCIGKSGLLITPEYGSRIKISAILTNITNLPLQNENKYGWIREYCDLCDGCSKTCPELAILLDPSSNSTKVIKELCTTHTNGCTDCIEYCPFHETSYLDVKKTYEQLQEKRILS